MSSPEDDRAELVRRREAIDGLDEEMLRLCAERLRHVVVIAGCKARLGLGVVDVQRERLLATRYADVARAHGLAPRVAEALYELLLRESKRHQHEAGLEATGRGGAGSGPVRPDSKQAGDGAHGGTGVVEDGDPPR